MIKDRDELVNIDKTILNSFSNEVRNIYQYDEEFEYMGQMRHTEYMDYIQTQLMDIQKRYSRMYPFLNVKRLMRVTQIIQIGILDFDFLMNCVVFENMPFYDREFHNELKDVTNWEYITRLNYNKLAKTMKHKKGLLEVADRFFNMFMDGTFTSLLNSGHKLRLSKHIQKYLDLFEYMSRHQEFRDILENVKDSIDFTDVRATIAGFYNTFYDGQIANTSYVGPSELTYLTMELIEGFFDRIEGYPQSYNLLAILNETLSDIEDGETESGLDVYNWTTTFEVELIQLQFLESVLNAVFDTAFDKLEQTLEMNKDTTQLRLTPRNKTELKTDAILSASTKLLSYTLCYVFRKTVL